MSDEVEGSGGASESQEGVRGEEEGGTESEGRGGLKREERYEKVFIVREWLGAGAAGRVVGVLSWRVTAGEVDEAGSMGMTPR